MFLKKYSGFFIISATVDGHYFSFAEYGMDNFHSRADILGVYGM